MEYEHIRYEVDEPVATIWLHRPEAMNAWTSTMGVELRDAVQRAAADPAVVGIVITGSGRAFCAGADMNTLTSLSSGGAAAAAPAEAAAIASAASSEIDDFDGQFSWLMEVPKPIVAAINGAVAGMAYPLVLCCDIRFMANEAVMLTAFSQRGLIAEWGLSWTLPRLVGTGAALDLLFTSRKIGGEEAARIGLVNAAVPREELLEHAVAYVRELALRSSPASMAVMKQQVYRQMHAGMGAAEADSIRLMRESFSRPDFAEGVKSFTEKRTPSFPRVTSPGD